MVKLNNHPKRSNRCLEPNDTTSRSLVPLKGNPFHTCATLRTAHLSNEYSHHFPPSRRTGFKGNNLRTRRGRNKSFWEKQQWGRKTEKKIQRRLTITERGRWLLMFTPGASAALPFSRALLLKAADGKLSARENEHLLE